MIKRIYFCDRCGVEYREPLVKESGVDLLFIDQGKDVRYKWLKDLCPQCAKNLAERIGEYFIKPANPTVYQGEAELANTIVITFENEVVYPVYYTLDGTDPMTSETRKLYECPFDITADCVIKTVAEEDRLFSDIVEYEATFVPELTAPVISCENNLVSIVGEEEAQTYYTTDGTEPTEESTLYTGIFLITETVTVKAVSMKDGKRSAVSEMECFFAY